MVLGYALPLDKNYAAYGAVVQPASIMVEGLPPTNPIQFEAVACFKGKSEGKNRYGASVPVWVYGRCDGQSTTTKPADSDSKFGPNPISVATYLKEPAEWRATFVVGTVEALNSIGLMCRKPMNTNAIMDLTVMIRNQATEYNDAQATRPVMGVVLALLARPEFQCSFNVARVNELNSFGTANR